MSAENLAIKDRFLNAVMTGQFAELRELLHPDFEMIQVAALPYGGVYSGPDGFLAFLDRFMGMLDIARLEGTDCFVSPNGTLVTEIAIKATLKDSGKAIDTGMLEKWEFADGKVRRISPHYFDPIFR